jgi:hypothetical protein
MSIDARCNHENNLLESLKNHSLKYINAIINLTSEIPKGSEIII